MSKRKTVRPGVREISPVSIYGEVYGGKDLRKRCVLSLEWKTEEVIGDGDRGGDDSMDPTCVGYSWVIWGTSVTVEFGGPFLLLFVFYVGC